MTRGALVFFLFVSIATLGTLGLRPLYKADESRYAEIPREMVASGDWVTPRLNGFKYFEKPPLQYWATATFFHVFGETDGAARLWTALTALAGIVLVFFWGRRLFGGEAAALGAFVLAGSPLYALLGQVNTLDMGLTFFLSAAVFAFALGYVYLFWAACALAVLSKGLIGIVLPLGAVALYILVKRDFSLLRKMKIVPGSLLFLVISAPWFVAVSLANPEFAHFFFIQEHFQRFTTKMHGRYQPAWYFLPIFAFGIAPWVLPFLAALAGVFRKAEAAFDARLFLWLWIGLVLAFFSASSSKLPSYILPVFPALALLIGDWLARTRPHRLLAAQAILAGVAGAAIAAFAPEAGRYGEGYVSWLTAGGVTLAVLGVVAAVVSWRGGLGSGVALLAGGSLACTLICVGGHRELSPSYSIAPQLAALGPPPLDARLFAVDFYDHTLPWYFGRTVTMVRYKDELGEAIKWEPQKFIAELPEFAAAWRAAPSAYAVFNTDQFVRLSKEIGVPMQVISSGPRYTIVRKP